MSQFNTLASYLGRLVTIETLVSFSVLAVITYLLRGRLALLFKLSNWKAIWLGWSICGVLAFTIRFWDSNGFNPVPWFLHFDEWQQIYIYSASWLLNVALFIPAGILLTAFGKRFWASLAGLLGFSTVIELFQQYTKYGIGDPSDFTANALGAAIGLGIGLLVRMLQNVRAN